MPNHNDVDRNMKDALYYGKIGEDFVENHLRSTKGKIIDKIDRAPDKRFKDWDLYVKFKSGNRCSYEVKADVVALRTKKLAIEFECNGELSGITATKASYWFQCLIDQEDNVFRVYKITTSELRKLITRVNPEIKIGGNGERVKMFVPLESYFEEYKIFDIPPKYKCRLLF